MLLLLLVARLRKENIHFVALDDQNEPAPASRERDRLFTSWRDVRTGRITYRYTQHHTVNTYKVPSRNNSCLLLLPSSILLFVLRCVCCSLACASTLVAAHKRCAKLKINFSGFFFLLRKKTKYVVTIVAA